MLMVHKVFWRRIQYHIAINSEFPITKMCQNGLTDKFSSVFVYIILLRVHLPKILREIYTKTKLLHS